MRTAHELRGKVPASALSRAMTVAVLSASALALWASSASAVIVHVSKHKALSYQPLRGAHRLSASPFAGKNLVYHGGPVMASNTNYAFYWAPSGSTSYAAGYQAGVNKYLEDLAHDSGGSQNVDSVATQYTDEAGEAANYNSHFGGALIDTTPYPASGCVAAPTCLTDAQIQTEIKSYVKAHGLPQDLAHEYFLLTPPGVESCFDATSKECSAGTATAAFCAYHGAISAAGGNIIYANDPYVVGIEGCDSSEHPNNSPSDAALLGGLSHEHNESTTDPELNAWFGPEGQENGDKCRTFVDSTEYGTPLGKAPDGSRYNQLINGAEYWYQQEWSNQGSTCLQRLTIAAATPTVKKIVPKKGATSGGTSVTITGTGFSGATAVRFGGTAASSFEVKSATSITAVSPAHSAGTIDVTVTTPGGTSAAVSKDRFKYGSPTVTAVSPSAGPAAGGTAVTITGSGFALGAGTTFNFGKAAASAVNCTSTTSCSAASPAAAKTGAVDVIAVVGAAKSKKSPPGDRFTYE
jgi:IPT/TIG domain